MVSNSRTDADIHADVLAELAHDQGVTPNEVGVCVSDGVVTLLGTVDSYPKLLAAVAAVHKVQGVAAVVNRLEVRLAEVHERADGEIAKAAVRAMRELEGLPAACVNVTVAQGMVTLNGTVATEAQRRAVEAAVHDLAGVRGVTNFIAVEPRVRAAEVQARIEDALVRSARMDARHIKVETRGGTVTLKGTVRSWSERADAEEAARQTPGVTTVNNGITVA